MSEQQTDKYKAWLQFFTLKPCQGDALGMFTFSYSGLLTVNYLCLIVWYILNYNSFNNNSDNNYKDADFSIKCGYDKINVVLRRPDNPLFGIIIVINKVKFFFVGHLSPKRDLLKVHYGYKHLEKKTHSLKFFSWRYKFSMISNFAIDSHF